MTQKVQEAMRFIEAFLALMLGKRVSVVWGAHAAYSTEGHIKLPRPVTGDEAEVALLTRLAMHEAGHAEETENGYAQRLTAEELTVFNVLEDPRMEAARCEKYPGATIVLSRGLGEMLQTLHANVLSGERSQVDAWQIDLLMRGFLAVAPHAPIRAFAPAILQALHPHVAELERAAIDEAIPQIAGLKTSRDAESLASIIVARMRQPEPPTPPPLEEPEDEASAEGTEADESSGEHEPPAEEAPSDEAPAESVLNDSQGDDQPAPDPGTATIDPTQDAPEQMGEAGSSGDSVDGKPAATTPHDASPAEGTSGGSLSNAVGAQAPPDGAASPDGAQASADQAAPDDLPSCDQQIGRGAGSDTSNPSDAAPMRDVDLGALLREALAQRYGDSGQTDDGDGAVEISDDDTKRLGVALASADPSEPLEKLLERSLLALAATSPMNPAAGSGLAAGMSLAPPICGVVPIDTRLQGVQAKLAVVLQRELQERRRRPNRLAHSGERIAASRFWRLERMGDTKIFNRRAPVTGIDCAATILVDSSLSTEPFLHVSLEIALAFSLALQRLGVRTKVVHFPATETVTGVLQRFGEPARVCVKRVSALSAGGGTPIGAAAAAELPYLLEQRKLKRVMAFVTDDGPGDRHLLLAVLERAEQEGVLVVGVGIGCDISAHIPLSVTVRSVTELPQALERLFRENISATLTA